VRIWTQAPAPQLGADHVTVSTSGVLPGMRRFLEECQAHLALSLNGTTDAQRSRLMPQNEQWPISELLDALRQSARQDAKRIFFIEYVPIEGINDSEADACRLLELLRGIPARVNLIAHNPFPGCELRPAPAERMLRFQRIVNDGGIRCMLRASRGREISAACGQLAGRI
jgi:23S rRNA (adenine2503-C2)-methyltransferase